MRNHRLTILALLAGLLTLSAAEADLGRPEGAWAQTEDLEVVDPTEVEPFARVREVETLGGESGVATSHRADGYLEEIYFNSPLYRGDRLETDGRNRAEIQFPDGSVVRLDTDTLVEIVSMRDPSGRFSGSNLLAVHMGRVQVELVDTEGERDLFRVDTFACSVYPLDRAAFRVDVVDSRAILVRVAAGSVEVVGEQDAVNLQAGEMTEAHASTPLGRPRPYNLLSRDHFGGWIESRDVAYALDAPPGEEYAELPEEIQPYYGELSGAGRWVWTEEYGQTWVPAVEPDWRPYYDGYWAYGPWGPTWVGYEPWGWVTYRYGRWNYLMDVGWAWVPGRVWSTAWVSWHYGPVSVGWAPLGFHGGPWFWHDPWGYPVGGGFHWSHHWHSYSTWNVVGYDEFYYRRVDKVAVRYKDPLPGTGGGGVVARRAVHTRRGESLRDGVERARTRGRNLDPVAPPGGTTQRRRAERNFLDEERRVLSPGGGRSASSERASRSERRAIGEPGQRESGRRGSQSEVSRRVDAGGSGSRQGEPSRTAGRGTDSGGRSRNSGRSAGSPGDGTRAYRTPAGRSASSEGARNGAPERGDRRSSSAGTARRPEGSTRAAAERGRSGGTATAGTPRAERPRSRPGRTSAAGEASSRDRLHRLLREASRERAGSAGRSSPSGSGRSTAGQGRSSSSRPRSTGSSSRQGSPPPSRRASPPPSRSRTSPGTSSGRSSPPRERSAGGGRSGSPSSPPAGRAGSSSRSSGTRTRSGGGTRSSGTRSPSSGGSKASGSKSGSSGGSKASGSKSGSSGGSKGRSSARSRR